MSSSASRGAVERTVHQDFIARVRYSNTLPPPPNPPKLLEIPNTGLGGPGGGYYTTPGFASRLVREQPLNIEADAELGMPLDLIGLPGVFDGDESAIQALPHPPPVHPHDRALLKPLSSLGKPRPSEASVSFLRRTEYISSVASKAGSTAAAAAASPLRSAAAVNKATRRPEKRPSPEPDAGTPAYVKRKIEQSFAAAQTAARDNYARVRHPTKKNVRLAAAYPLLPDLDAFPDTGAYVTVKFSHTPVVAGAGVYDTRLLSGIFRPVEQTDEERAAFEAATKLWERDPRRHRRPQNRMRYEFYLPAQAATGDAFRRVFAADDAEAADQQEEPLDFVRIRSYEPVDEKELSHATKYAEEILLALADDAAAAAPGLGGPVAGGPRAALYYPVMQRTTVRSQRQKQIAARTAGAAGGDAMDDGLDGGADGGADRPVDRLQVSVREPPEEMRTYLARIRADPLHFDEAELDAEGEEEAVVPGSSSRGGPSGRGGDDEDDEDDDRGGLKNGRDKSAGSRTNGHGNGHRYSDEVDEEDGEGEDE